MDGGKMIPENIKKRLIEAAEKKYGGIKPCSPAFFEDRGIVYFWFNSMDNSTHLLHIHRFEDIKKIEVHE
jgi:hypothetical protein